MTWPLGSIRKLRESIGRIERDLTLVKEQVEELEREAMRRPSLDEVTSALGRAAQLAERLRGLPEEERKARFFENLEKIRAEAIEKGIAIDDEREAAVDD